MQEKTLLKHTPPGTKRPAWQWVPAAYFYQAIPNTVMQSLLVYFYMAMEVNPEVSGVTISLLYLPWFIKPLWGPIVDILKTKKWWAVWTQALVGLAFVAAGCLVGLPHFFAPTLVAFIVVSLSAATYDVASDGMYMIHLTPNQQSIWVGLRSTAFRLGWLLVDGGLLWLVGSLLVRFRALGRDAAVATLDAWRWVFFALAGITFLLLLYSLWAFPQDRPRDAPGKNLRGILRELGESIVTFFRKPRIGWGVAFLVTYRAGEAQLVQILPRFLTAEVAAGGLGIAVADQGIIKGLVGVLSLILGGILGGFAIARKGLRYWMLPMILSLSLPNAGYWLLSQYPEVVHRLGAGGLWLVGAAVGLEYFGYGFSFASYTMYMVYVSRGRFATAHYALCSGFMALSLIWPKAISGYTFSWLGFEWFFVMVTVAGLVPALLLYRKLGIDSAFGKAVK
jgi:PAT family beta-lactamase induction signal transducer AmpG